MVLISHLGEAINSAVSDLFDFAQYFNVSAERLQQPMTVSVSIVTYQKYEIVIRWCVTPHLT
jgi:hypothetical protein